MFKHAWALTQDATVYDVVAQYSILAMHSDYIKETYAQLRRFISIG